MKPFFVTGFPRSRTAWLANLLTTDASIVFHDAPAIVPSGSWKQVGFAGPELAEQHEELMKRYPGCKWVVVRRKADDARAAFEKWAGALLPQGDVMDKLWRERVARVDALCQCAEVQPIPYACLDDAAAVRELWDYLLPEIAFDEERFRVLNDLNVSQNLTKGLARWQPAQ